MSEWIEQYRVFWAGKLNALEQFLDKETPSAHKGQGVAKPIKKSKRK
ncbi:MAG: hypothetical protein WKG06_38655 [Segetibacter sp.]